MKRWMMFVLPVLVPGCIAYTNVDVGLTSKLSEFKERVVSQDPEPQGKIALIDIDGVISDEAKDTLLRTKDSTVVAVVEKLKRAERDPEVKGVILRMNTPGGDVTASDILYQEVRSFKARKKVPVVSVFMGVSASGGYYIASASDRIVAHPTTITGSIGVIAMHVSLSGLLEKIGVKVEALKSGAHKDIGSPFKDLSDGDRKLLQGLIDQMYARFVSVVAEGRKGILTEQQILSLADGRVYTAAQALEAKLIDRIGYLDDGFAEAKGLAQLKSAQLVMYARNASYAENAYSPTPTFQSTDLGGMEWARQFLGFHLYYIWEPYVIGK